MHIRRGERGRQMVATIDAIHGRRLRIVRDTTQLPVAEFVDGTTTEMIQLALNILGAQTPDDLASQPEMMTRLRKLLAIADVAAQAGAEA